MQDINIRKPLNKAMIIDILLAVVIIMAALYAIYLKINNASSDKNFLQSSNIFDEIENMKTQGVSFININSKVESYFAGKENISSDVIYNGTNGRSNPFSILNK